jgi:hypothetical protein
MAVYVGILTEHVHFILVQDAVVLVHAWHILSSFVQVPVCTLLAHLKAAHLLRPKGTLGQEQFFQALLGRRAARGVVVLCIFFDVTGASSIPIPAQRPCNV